MKYESFRDQIAIVSGSGDGIGKMVAKKLAENGVRLALFDNNEKKLITIIEELRQAGCQALHWCVDISDEAAVQQACEEVKDAFGKIDIMINCAGVVGPTSTSILDYEVSDFDKMYAVNLRGSFLMAKYALKHMSEKNYGRVLLITSMAGKEGNPFMAGYSASKAGVIGLVKGLGKEFATTGITVNGLAPTIIKTAMADAIAPDHLQYMKDKVPMGRLGTTEEVANVVTFVVSKENSFSTGFIYDVSGGRATY